MPQREQIVKTSTEMFLNLGLKSVRMDDIARQLGMSKRTLYEMFNDKSTLVEECFVYHISKNKQLIEERTSHAANVMEEIFIMLGHMKQDEKEAAFMSSLKRFYPEIFERWITEIHKKSLEQLDLLLARGIEQELFVPGMNQQLAPVVLV